MPELDVHIESAENDPEGKRVGALAAVIAVVLAIVTILSHRAHTDAVVLKTEANDQWTFYQAKSLKGHSVGIGRDLLTALEVNTAASRGILTHYEAEQKRYEKESEEIKREAQGKDEESKLVERRALRYDLGEGLLEIGLVLSSLYFIARRRMFPWVGLIAAISGAGIALSTLLLR
jgi:hypothetical protein